MRKLFLLILMMGILMACEDPTGPARDVIERFAEQSVRGGDEISESVTVGSESKKLPQIKLSLSMEKVDGCDQFRYEVKDGVLHIDGSSNVALCRAFYEYVR
nr:hypothetical protein [Bacteroidales bacterium]